MKLTERKKQILKIVIEQYITSADPVGSRTIARKMQSSISSATIRNELSDLTEMGYLEQPHTSAGRVPSPMGYRFYVNELMEQQKLSLSETEEINRSLKIKMDDLDRMISQAGRAVSAYVSYPSYAAAAVKHALTVKRFELLWADENSCIAVIMTDDDRVKSQLLRIQLRVDANQLPRLTGLLNERFTGIPADEMSRRLMDVSNDIPPQLFLLLSQVVSYATDTLDAAARREVITAGANQLLKLPEYQDAEKAHQLMSFLADSKEDLPMPTEGGAVQILIGPENVSQALQNTSVVVASYDIGENMRGLIGVVGPTRMDYAAVAARLSGFAEGLTRMFGKHGQLPPKG